MRPYHADRGRQGSRVAAIMAVLAMSLSMAALAKPPAQQEVPGYYRMALGSFQVTARYDGWIALEPALLNGASEEDVQALLARMFMATTEGVQTAVNGYAPQVIATRRKIFADAALDKLWVAGARLPFPGLGRVRAETRGYSWVPVEIGPVPAAKP